MAADIPAEFRARWEVPAFQVRLDSPRRQPACVLIPVINEGRRIGDLLDRMSRLGIASHADIVIVDGGSSDGSLEPVALAAHGVRALLVKTGPGRLSAQLRCGYAFVLDEGYRDIVTIDGNNKDDPGAIPRFIDALRNGFDFVQASRFIKGGIAANTPLARTLAIRGVHAPLLSLCSGFRWTDTTQGFRAYSRRMLLDPKLNIFRSVFSDYELLAYLSYRAPRLGYRCIELPSIRRYPAAGKVPTKIRGLSGNVAVLMTLIRACAGTYNG
jgi:glycosyltransferase involved in cell wall biosynthesis